MKPFTTKTYKISTDNKLMDKINNISPFVRHILETIHRDVQAGKKSMIKKLETYCESYPEVPVFKNLLSSIYAQRDDFEKALEVNEWLIKEHPDYFFGKINRALQYLEQDQPEKVPEILGESLEIGLLYPERNEFHFEEVLAFNEICVRYFIEMGLPQEAKMRVEIMQDIDEEHPRTLQADQILKDYLVARAEVRREEDRVRSREVKLKDVRSYLQTTQAPAFHFQEQMSWLYEDGLDIDPEKISAIIQLDPEKLRQDLEKILYDSVHRFDYFKKEEAGNRHHSLIDLPTHALLLLSELKSEKSIDAILYLLRQDKEFMDFWFPGFYFDQLNMALFYCGMNNMDRIFEFLNAPNIHGYNKSLVGENLVTIIQHAPKDRTRYVAEYRSLLKKFIGNPDDKDFVDTHSVSALVWDVCELGYQELLPEIRQLYDLNLVEHDMVGTYEEVTMDMGNISDPYEKYINLDIFEKYDSLYDEGEDSFPASNYTEEQFLKNFPVPDLSNYRPQPKISSPKIGRNDPCPCGSGKKYKKCCL